MTIKEIHYIFQLKLNSNNSLINRNFLAPQIDIFLNQAQYVYLNKILNPKNENIQNGLELNQNSIDKLSKFIVLEEKDLKILDSNGNYYEYKDEILYELPSNYLHFISCNLDIIYKNNNISIKENDKNNNIFRDNIRLRIVQHDDIFEHSVFSNTSYIYQEVNGNFESNTNNKKILKIYCKNYLNIEDSVIIKKIIFKYIRRPTEVCLGGYIDFEGNTLGEITCEFNDEDIYKIIDEAVIIATQNMINDINVKAINTV